MYPEMVWSEYDLFINDEFEGNHSGYDKESNGEKRGRLKLQISKGTWIFLMAFADRRSHSSTLVLIYDGHDTIGVTVLENGKPMELF